MSTAPATADVGTVFAALSDPHRRRLLEALGDHPTGASATALARPLPVSRQAVDKHLRVLERAGLVASARHGREIRFAVRREQLDRSAAWLTELADRWDQRLGRLKAAAESADDHGRTRAAGADHGRGGAAPATPEGAP
ncbi:metalloregulator ArsR/SmtB family transcription factor [Blastococcus montanus]|uniref:ArsR/SmtB family transcription factor n=1 Tax=Blastococcus montanus TaxID=3144973 RepID=UPI003209ADE7